MLHYPTHGSSEKGGWVIGNSTDAILFFSSIISLFVHRHHPIAVGFRHIRTRTLPYMLRMLQLSYSLCFAST
jgi:hypothetical protein